MDMKALFVLPYCFRFNAYQAVPELCGRARLDTYVPNGKINAVQAMLVNKPTNKRSWLP